MQIKSPKNEFLVEDITLEHGLKISSKNTKITIFDKKTKEKIIEERFNQKYRELLELVLSVNEDSSEDDALYVRDRINELRNYLLNKYAKYVSKNILNKYLKMLLLLEQKLIIPKKQRGR